MSQFGTFCHRRVASLPLRSRPTSPFLDSNMSGDPKRVPETPRTPRRRPFSPVAPRSPGTPRRHIPPRATRLQGITDWKYTVEQTREMVKTKLNLTYTPDDWQIHLIIRILRGYDSIFHAGTGYGKSLIFEAVTALRGRKKVTIIICPLKALEADQVRVIGQSRFRILHMD